MITKIKNKLSKLTAKDWIAISLWLVAFALLLAFVISAAVIDHSSSTPQHVDAQEYAFDKKPDDVYDPTKHALLKAVPILKDGKHAWSMPAHDANVATFDKDLYANALAGLGATFAVALIAAMFTTTWFAYKKKQGGNK